MEFDKVKGKPTIMQVKAMQGLKVTFETQKWIRRLSPFSMRGQTDGEINAEQKHDTVSGHESMKRISSRGDDHF